MENSTDIYDFLPKYPYVSNGRLDNTLLPYRQPFNDTIFKKKEFYENRLDKIEHKPTIKGKLMKHQENIAKYMAGITPYDGILLFHAMGSGKACSAVGIAEKLRAGPKKVKGVIFITRGPTILNNLVKELVYVCTDGKYIPDDLDKIQDLMKIAKLKRSLKPFYNFYTIDGFIKILANYTQADIEKKFSNYCIIIDEVHHLRNIKDIGEYQLIHKFLHTIKNKKVVLMSGTPMSDQPNELADIMNLILPLDNQMPTGSQFDNRFLIPETQYVTKLDPDNIAELKNYIRGRVSYLKSIKSDVMINYVGEKIGTLNYLTIFPEILEPDSIQNVNYLLAYKSDIVKSGAKLDTSDVDETGDIVSAGLYSNSKQASVAVYPDGSYGTVGFNRYISESIHTELRTGKQHSVFRLKTTVQDADGKKIDNLSAFLKKNGNDVENKLKQLEKISLGFTHIISKLLENASSSKPKSSFVYCNWVKGSGCILFAKILELFGFTQTVGNETTGGATTGGAPNKKLRYALLTSSVCTENQISNYINTFNHPDNMYGEIVNVIIGSKIIGEGISLLNVQDIHILTPHWNFTVTEQALARAVRAFSHNKLEESGVDVVVDIYLHTTIPSSVQKGEYIPIIDDSIDLKMYERSEDKDISIKRVEQVIKEASIDCALNYRRNYRNTGDGDRDCEYNLCDYRCDNVPMELIENGVPNDLLDLSTYRLYYDNHNIRYIQDQIYFLFKTNFILPYEQLRRYFGQYSEFELLSALYNITNKNMGISNKYSFTSYIQEQNNNFFLSHLGSNDNILDTYYSQYPSIKTQVTFNDIVKRESTINYPKLISKICNMSQKGTGPAAQKNQNAARVMILKKLPLAVVEMFLEYVFIANRRNIHKSKDIQEWIFNILGLYLFDVTANGKKYIVSGLLSSYDTYKYFDNEAGIWRTALPSSKIYEMAQKYQTNLVKRLETNKMEYYGIVGFDTFYVKNTKIVSAQAKGRDCKTTPLYELYYILLKLELNQHIPKDYSYPNNASMIKRIGMSNDITILQKEYSGIKIKSLSSNILKILYWYINERIQKPIICQHIYETLLSKKLLIGYYMTSKTITGYKSRAPPKSRK